MAGVARYDEIADFYAAGWTDDIDDPASRRLLDLLEPIGGRRVLEIACGHGRISRALARRGAEVVGADISAALIGKAEAAERESPLGIRYVHTDVTAGPAEAGGPHGELRGLGPFDVVVCSFGLSDIDDLDGAVATAAAALRPGGVFACSILHPCFPGGPGVSGSWPGGARYHAEGWWRADGELSSLRRQVGAHHRTLSTYLNTLRRHDLWVEELAEPEPAPEWASERPEAARFPVFLVLRCVKGGVDPRRPPSAGDQGPPPDGDQGPPSADG
ncbi:2-polyprenyl-3-methyl-5-hydroxy-6-metoxy-1,4-benzoquinol methylase [Nonomuraea thailandensis]|uniref:2-polyprenyl-3-methyl-5-hydroxy-6-metoxy-1, 4-benzoquinol methylase n=1 Tax=Nonomuraea thailandensis TaxID=1188745 RepID=A0A9X2GJZ0_9ACTN|nr:class I SAM-dependent methyltransferase [Nonomuraea thailandensis]MCP2360569.1 2-polyprenyl-3-methyl-5-hydroxy-6-metoxy-1,4-benzoquinol methylase [Nonomuraea thailandensis]